MSKEPRGGNTTTQQQANNTNNSGRKYVTAQNFHLLDSRVKPLPPTADTSKLPNNGNSTTLFQLKEHVEFRCGNCRRDKITDDALALDSQTGRITCQRCFSRLIRPRSYKPTRLVPFPSLLSWLNFSGGSGVGSSSVDAFSSSSNGAGARMAEAVIPSEARARNNNFGGSNNNGNVAGLLTSTPMVGLQQNAAETLAGMRNNNNNNYQSNNSSSSSNQQQRRNNNNNNIIDPNTPHPCAAVFDQAACTHGVTCFFAKAPGNLCLAYLMGLCSDSSPSCGGRLHQKVFDLPRASSATPDRWEIVEKQQHRKQDGDNESSSNSEDAAESTIRVAQETQSWKNFVEERKNSKNQPEWQLWNQENLVSGVVDRFLPMPKVEQPKQQQQQQEKKPLNASAIESLLKSMKK